MNPYSTSNSSKASQPKESRAWQRMLSGRRLDLLNPGAVDVEIGDIAHGLARLARWNGQTNGDHSLSVAQHSLIVEELLCLLYPEAPRTWRLVALLHDAPEYVVGDLISPFKAVIGFDYKIVEKRLLEVIHIKFGLPANPPATVARLVKQADGIAAYFEAVALAGFDTVEALSLFGEPGGLDEAFHQRFTEMRPLPAPEAQHKFLQRFEQLSINE
ncbi:MAG: HD family hydrolase [Hyphomicrobiaceae bacterium]|nr:HD family hydrolase [Hyphomicrobiaceae bacterium]